jgi:hypothetical protein
MRSGSDYALSMPEVREHANRGMASDVGKDPLTDWSFSVDEVSAGVYRASGADASGRMVETTGTDPDMTLEKCKRAAFEIANQSMPQDSEDA